ncbi:MAG: UDP-N-acetylglucosamine 1-carboxyvinyltransferase, partial [Mucinivorans sp.]
MAQFEVTGSCPLSGEITPQGAKNEALQVLCAVLLTEQRVEINNIPEIADVMQLIDLLRDMGVQVERIGDGHYAFSAREVDLEVMQGAKFRAAASRLRGSVMMIGPLLARYGRAFMPKPGGDKIGRRRLDTHFIGFQALGAEFNFDTDDKFYTVSSPRGLSGAYMLLDEASVTGTANIIMAAVMAQGQTTIYNAACEPYIQQLCRMLVRMGAKISGIASNRLLIEGV